MLIRALIGKLDLYLVDPASDFQILNAGTSFKFAAMVVNQASKLLQLQQPKLEFLLLGGSAIPAPLEQALQQLPTRCFSSYAMTETATHIALRELNADASDKYYHCLNDIHVSLNEKACLRINMPGLPNGFLQTTDLAELDGTGKFRILGRADNRIISGGLKFSPEELEKKLESKIPVPFFITSKAHTTLGQQLVLVAESPEKQELSKLIEEQCQILLERYEQPREIIFMDALPRTENGKIKRISAEQL